MVSSYSIEQQASKCLGTIRMFACYVEILKEKNRSSLGQSSVFHFRSHSQNWATPPVLLDMGDDGTNDLRTVQKTVSPTENIIGLSFHTLFFFISWYPCY